MRIKNYSLNLKLLNQINNLKNKKIVFWGASLFLKDFLNENSKVKDLIVGIVDTNSEKWNTQFEGLDIISPESLLGKTVNIIFTIQNDYDKCYQEVSEYISNNLPCAKLEQNIFKEFYNELYDNNDINITFLKPSQKDIDLLESLGDDYKPYSKMVNQDRLFLSTLVSRKKPKKILEVGVSSGGSSYIMLNALKNTDSHIFALDYNINHRDFEGKKCGFYINEKHPELKQQWTFYAGGLSLNFLDKISSSENEEDKFDFCFIDTAHVTPCEILDTLQVFPYLKKNATLVYHDTNLHLYAMSHPAFKTAFLNNLLMSAVKGHKILPVKTNAKYVSSISDYVANIGAIELNPESFKSINDIFNLLALEWYYLPKEEEIIQLQTFFERHYGNYWADYFMSVVEIQKVLFEKYKKTGRL